MPIDYLHDANDDLQISNGDFVRGESTQQHQGVLIRVKQGELRQFPKTGVGIDAFLLDDNAGDIFQEIQKQFEADGMIVRNIDIKMNGVENELQLKIDAYYP